MLASISATSKRIKNEKFNNVNDFFQDMGKKNGKKAKAIMPENKKRQNSIAGIDMPWLTIVIPNQPRVP